MKISKITAFWQPLVAGALLGTGLLLSWQEADWFQSGWVRLAWYVVSFLPVGLNVMREAWECAAEGDFFSEFMLMSVACIGAFCIGEYPEAVAVMWLYHIGETLQDKAVEKARGHIKSLMAFRPDRVRLAETGQMVAPEAVDVGCLIEVLPGERVPLDGVLPPDAPCAEVNTAALTGESIPRTMAAGQEILAGMVVMGRPVQLEVRRKAADSALARILKMVEEAAERKAPTELFVRRFAHVYTPVVIVLALLTVLLPWVYSLLNGSFYYDFSLWLNRALVFLVISCPCALVVSIPLSYFAGIGTASRQGILFKGGGSLDALTGIDTVVFDKTGTLTTGIFEVQEVSGLSEEDLQTVVAMERSSNHPIAQAIAKGHEGVAKIAATDLPGYGLSAVVNGETWLVGTLRLMEKEGIAYPEALKQMPETIVACARHGCFKGYLLLSDTLKADARQAIDALKAARVGHIEMLSGDKQALVDRVAQQLGIEKASGDLLPEQKAERIEVLKRTGKRVAFVGDGINDAPVLALSHVGIAMGGMGADMAIETADVVLQADLPSHLAVALRIGRRTRRIVVENIAFALGVKLLVMGLGILGVANLWEAVFADSGVALLAVLNALRVKNA